MRAKLLLSAIGLFLLIPFSAFADQYDGGSGDGWAMAEMSEDQPLMHGPTSVTPQTEEIVEIQAIPAEFALAQNVPNPFNPRTIIAYQLPEASEVRLTVYNTGGQLVQVLVDERKEAGYYTAIWDARGLGSGIYLYRLEAGTFIQTRKMVKIE